MAIIIGTSAKKQGGKSTLVEAIQNEIRIKRSSSIKVIRFADTLKQIVIDCFIPPEMNITHQDQLDSEEVKNQVLPCGKKIREVLQIVGTDQFRSIWQDCWINAYMKKVQQANVDFILTPDVRFSNELKAVQKMGGKVIRLLRAPLAEDEHESETALDDIQAKSVYMRQFKYCDGITTFIDSEYPGDYFDIIYNNKEKSLADATVWAKRFVNNCIVKQRVDTELNEFYIDLTRF